MVLPDPGPLRGAPAEEVGVLHRWLGTGGTRLVHAEPTWTEPARSAASWAGWAQRARPVVVDPDRDTPRGMA